jgi:regulator of sigma E protease
MSFVLAYVVFCALGLTVGLPVQKGAINNRVDLVIPDTEAYRAGLNSGDVIVGINGKKITTGMQMLNAIHDSAYKRLAISVDRQGKIVEIYATPKPQELNFSEMGFSVELPEKSEVDRVDSVEPHSPAFRVGLKPGDVIISIDGKRIASGIDITNAVHDNPGHPLAFVVSRGDRPVELKITPDPKALDQEKDKVIGLLGFIPTQNLKRAGLRESVHVANEETFGFAGMLVKVIFSRQVGQNVGGPLAIADATQTSVKRGWNGFLQLMGMLSLSLGVVNLLPIPVMDGGQMALLLGEAIRGRRLSQRTMEIAQMVGLAMIAMIFVAVMYLDIGRIADGKLFR